MTSLESAIWTGTDSSGTKMTKITCAMDLLNEIDKSNPELA